MLGVVGEDGVKDPGETEDWVDDHYHVVYPWFEGRDIPEEWMSCVRLEQGKVHEQIPDC